MDSIDFVSILIVAIGLSADCFAVALGVSTQVTERFPLQVLRVSLSFGLFQALMPILGWLAGTTVVEYIENFDHWVAFVLLAIVGGRMIWESFHSPLFKLPLIEAGDLFYRFSFWFWSGIGRVADDHQLYDLYAVRYIE